MGKQKGSTRRNVWVGGLTLAGGCFAGVDLRALAAQAAATRKPLLTQESLTALMRSLASAAAYKELADDPDTDLVGFLSRHFTLTPAQIALIKTIPADQVAALKQAARKATSRSAASKSASKDAGFVKKIIGDKAGAGSDRGEKAAAVTTSFDGSVLTVQVTEISATQRPSTH